MLTALFAQDMLLFTVPALLGTLVFLLKLGLMGLGADGHTDVDGGGALEVEVHGDAPDLTGHDAQESTDAFKLLSLQSIAAFAMGFGWGGVGARLGMGWSVAWSLVVGAAIGAGFVWLLGMLMKAVYDLQSSGNVSIREAAGLSGTVYANVPARGEGRGQVRLVIRERARTFNAVSEDGALASGSAVRVVRVNDDHTVTVTAM